MSILRSGLHVNEVSLTEALGQEQGFSTSARFGRRAVLFLAMQGLVMSAAGALGESASAVSRPIRVLCLGDSLTAGYLLPADHGFVPVLARALRRAGLNVELQNAGVSGDTTTAAYDRLDWALQAPVDVAIVELGANDMFRGLDPSIAEAALDAILAKLQARGARLILAGMLASPALGDEYRARFDGLYPRLAKKFDAAFYPFFLEGVAGDPALNLSDGIHPNKAGVERIVAGIAPLVEAVVRDVAAKAGPDRQPGDGAPKPASR